MTEKMMKFLEAAEKDEALAEAVKNAASLDEVLVLAKEHGIDLTPADMRPELPAGEIDDDMLDEVAGGVVFSMKAASMKSASMKAASVFENSMHAASMNANAMTANSILESLKDLDFTNGDYLIQNK